MTHQDTIREFLFNSPGAVCDDCISARTGISPRQTVNLNCRRLATSGKLRRIEQTTCPFCRDSKICNVLRGKSSPSTMPTARISQKVLPASNPYHAMWFWEGNVQARLVEWLASEGWTIEIAADTAAKTPGKDIVASQTGRLLWVSVKGYPRGTSKTNPSTQCRHWFSHAVFDVTLYRDEDPAAELAIGLPDGYSTYLKLADRIRWLRHNLPLTIYWVRENGEVRPVRG